MRFYKGNLQRTRAGMLDFEWPMCPPIHAAVDEVKAVWMTPNEQLTRWSKRRWRARWNNCSNESATSRLQAAFDDLDSDADSWWIEPGETGQSKRERFIAQYLFLPNSGNSIPGQSRPCPACNADGYVVVDGHKNHPRPTHVPHTRAVPYRDLDKDTFVISDDSETTQPQLELKAPESDEHPKLPSWLQSARLGSVDKHELHSGILDCLEAIKGERPTKRYSTDGKALLAFWKSVKDDYGTDLRSWVEDVWLVAMWAQQSPDKLAAYDIRAEGWDGGTDRSRNVGTILRREKWGDRLSAAIRWRDSGTPQGGTPRGPESISGARSTMDPSAEVKALVSRYGSSWRDGAWPALEARMSDPGIGVLIRALAVLGGATSLDNLSTDERIRHAGIGYIRWCRANSNKVQWELEPALIKAFKEVGR